VRTDDGVYVFLHGFMDTVVVEHHHYAEDDSHKADRGRAAVLAGAELLMNTISHPARVGRAGGAGPPHLLLSLDISVLYLALPHLSAALDADSTQQLWIIDIYSFMLAGFLVTMGTLGDRVGRRKLLLIGAAVFGAASILAAYASTSWQLIARARIAGRRGRHAHAQHDGVDPQHVPRSEADGRRDRHLVQLLHGRHGTRPARRRDRCLEHFWWGSAFLLGVPFMVLLLVVGPVLLPEYRDTHAGRLDPVSVALSLAAILPLIYGLKELARHGFAPIPALAMAMGSRWPWYGFVRRQGYLRSPLLDLKLFRNRTFTVALATMLLGGVVMAGVSLMSTNICNWSGHCRHWTVGCGCCRRTWRWSPVRWLAPMLARRIQPAYVIALGAGHRRTRRGPAHRGRPGDRAAAAGGGPGSWPRSASHCRWRSR
jgi:DHA2 family multidrug resistance protein-like MFS transporter